MKMPYTEALLISIPRTQQPSHSRLRAIMGRPPDLVSPPTGWNFAPRCPYAQERCLTDEPPLMPADTPGHEFACWYPVGTPESKAALERNLAEGRPQTVAAVTGVVTGAAAIEAEVSAEALS